MCSSDLDLYMPVAFLNILSDFQPTDIRCSLVVLVREALDELIGAGQLRHTDALFLAGVLIAPAEVVEDGAGEQDVLLEHHGDLVAEDVEVIIPDIHAAHADGAGLGVVQAGDELHQTGLCAAGAADDAQRLAGPLKINFK